MANTLNLGNGNWGVKKDSLLGYNSENNNYKPLPFDFTRASSATVVNKQGLIETVGSGEPRIDFLGNTNGALKLEPQRSNLITYSEAFDNAYWTKSGSSVTSGFTSPDGTANAFTLVEDTSTAGHFLYNAQGGDSKTFSFFAKSLGNQYVAISYDGGNNFNFFDIINGQLGTITDSSKTSKIENYGNGWFRCSLYNGSSVFGATIWMSKDGINTSYAGDGTSGVYIYGAQLEASYATSYIPTSGSAVTRVADACNNGGNDQVINSTEGVLYAEIAGFSNDTVRYSISDGSNSNNIYIELSSSAVSAVGRLSAVNQFSIFSLQTITNYNKIAIKYKQNDFALWINGVEVGTDTSGNTYPTNTLDSLQFNRGDGGVVFYGNVKDIRVYNTVLTDNELQQLTTI